LIDQARKNPIVYSFEAIVCLTRSAVGGRIARATKQFERRSGYLSDPALF
jgi:hypothetical protein